ncbi:hypothetical protein D9619_010483 [Psilocybe cf. subviscida]|uniref:Uncharacterized protein n=1 Tax=Psilocybe cf. subviscida TaxID=2480587 RepID=A0A8H5ES37_9AGAR|nr:hypothetical protein D9619_010483 [Psilocybe cf. subviscida]
MSNAEPGSPLIPKPIAQALLDSLLGTTIVQSLLTGLYGILFIQTIVPLIRDGKRKVHTSILILLFSIVIINLGTTWQILRNVMITYNDTRNTMVMELMGGPLQIPLAANATGCIAVLIADSLLVWRCYVLWRRNKILLAFFTLLLLGEVALIPILLLLNANLGPGKVSFIPLFFFLSVGITVLATGLIIYRIVDVFNRIPGERSRYQYVIEALVESGLMYSTTLLISGVLMVVRSDNFTNCTLVQASAYWGGILTPVTGIAPTLITMRTVSGKARDEATWTQPVSGIIFNNAPRSQTKSISVSARSTEVKEPSNDSFGGHESGILPHTELGYYSWYCNLRATVHSVQSND